MTEKICDFCGEPIAGGLQEHDFATCAHNLKDKVAKLEVENELLWMYYKANKESDYDSFQEAEKRIKALGGES